MKKTNFTISLLIIGIFFCAGQQTQDITKSCVEKALFSAYKTGELIYEDSFNTNLDNYVPEFKDSPCSEIKIIDNKLVIDVEGGATVWLNKKLSGNILIEYNRTVVVDSGKNDRLSDVNQFWMATDPRNENLFTRSGVFREYDSLLMYYFGFGGNRNTTTRFRKYDGNGQRILICDYKDKNHLPEANRMYRIKITIFNGATKVYIDDKEIISYEDPDPLTEGYFGFRTTGSRQAIDDLKIYRLVE